MEWGVQIHRAVGSRELTALRSAGVGLLTVPLPWGWCERREGTWDFPALEHFLRPIRESGLAVQGLLGPGISEGWPPWLLKRGGADLEDYVERFAGACAQLAQACEWISIFRVEQDLNAAFWWDGLRTRKRRGKRWRDEHFRHQLLSRAVEAVWAVRPDAHLWTTFRPGLPGWQDELRETVRALPQFDRIGLSLPASGIFSSG